MTIQYEAYHPATWSVKTPKEVLMYESLEAAIEAHPDADLDLPAMAMILEAILG